MVRFADNVEDNHVRAARDNDDSRDAREPSIIRRSFMSLRRDKRPRPTFDAAVTPVGDFFGAATQYEAPVFQRRFCWTRELARTLFEDVARVDAPPHLLGRVLLCESPRDANVLLVVDGQQRITSLLLLGAALARHAACDEASRARLDRICVTDRWLPTPLDREEFRAALEWSDDAPPLRKSSRLAEIRAEFECLVAAHANLHERLVARFCDAIELVVLHMRQRDESMAQLLFESFARNDELAKQFWGLACERPGAKLRLCDQVRNLLLFVIASTDGENNEFYVRQWLPFERAAESSGEQLDACLERLALAEWGVVLTDTPPAELNLAWLPASLDSRFPTFAALFHRAGDAHAHGVAAYARELLERATSKI